VEIVQGDITEEDVHAIVNSSGKNMGFKGIHPDYYL
jgi:O-acetyl-ADP-ribose deacetylase (regulator of RNase III)